ncbi:hypothetical protein ABBQ32_011352 [Trebouxia sp. C0010 RCD-2024]
MDVFGNPEIITVPSRKRVRPRLTKAQKEAGFTVPELYQLRGDVWVPKEHPPEPLKVKDLLAPRAHKMALVQSVLGTGEAAINRAHVPAGPEGLLLYELAVAGHGSPAVTRLLMNRRWMTDTTADRTAAAKALREEMQGRPVDEDVLRDQESPAVENDVTKRASVALRRGRLTDMELSDKMARDVTNSVVVHLSSSSDTTSGSSAERGRAKKKRINEIGKAFIDKSKRSANKDLSTALTNQDGLTSAEERLLQKFGTETDLRIRQSIGKVEAEKVRRLRMQKHAAESKRLHFGEWDAEAADIVNRKYENNYGYPPIEPAPYQMGQMQAQVDEWWGDSGGSDLSMEVGEEDVSSREVHADLGVGRRHAPKKRARESAIQSFAAARAARKTPAASLATKMSRLHINSY